MIDSTLLNAILRHDFPSFIARCFMTLDPGTAYLPNWHIYAIAYQLTRVPRDNQDGNGATIRVRGVAGIGV